MSNNTDNDKNQPTLIGIAKKIIASPFKVYPSLEFRDSIKDIKTYWLNFSIRF